MSTEITGKETNDDGLKTIRVLAFSGKESDWNRWSKTFMALAKMRGLSEAYKPAGEKSKATEKEKEKAYNLLMLASEDEIVFGIIDEAGGDPAVAWKNLEEKFEPKTGASKVQLKLEFQQSKLNIEDDPDEWMTNLELLRRKLKVLQVEIDDEDMILHILNNLPKEYENTIEMCEAELTENKLSLNTLKERLRTKCSSSGGLSRIMKKMRKKPPYLPNSSRRPAIYVARLVTRVLTVSADLKTKQRKKNISRKWKKERRIKQKQAEIGVIRI